MYCMCCCQFGSEEMRDDQWGTPEQYLGYNSFYGSSYWTYSDSSSQITSDGNPQPCRKHTWSATTSAACEYVFVFSVNLYLPRTYTPSVDGAISQVSYTLSHKRTVNPSSPNNIVVYPILKQGGTVYTKGGFTHGSSWDTDTVLNNGSSWAKLLPTAGVDYIGATTSCVAPTVLASENPDFSSSGGEIEFGYCVNAFFGSSSSSISTSGEILIDNFCVEVIP